MAMIFGINFGHDIVEGGYGGAWNASIRGQLDRDLDYLINHVGIKHFRCGGVGLYWFGVTSDPSILLDKMRYIAKRPLELGADSVQYLLDFEMYDGSWIGYQAYVEQEAAWAESVGITRLQLANELELDNNAYTQAQERDFVQSTVAMARGAGYTGAVTHALAGGPYAWTGPGTMDDVGFNGQVQWTQGTTTGFKNFLNTFVSTIGANYSYVSEWSLWDNQHGKHPTLTLEAQAKIVLDYLKGKFANSTIPQYFFTWKKPDDAYVIKNILTDNKVNKYFYSITDLRHDIVQNTHDFVHHSRPKIGSYGIGDIGGKILWLKGDEGVYADNGRTLCSTYGQQVQLWYDFSGKGNHARQDTSYKRPHWHSNELNGKPIIWVNRGDFNTMTIGSQGNFNLISPTIFLVARMSAGVSFFGKGDATNYPYYDGSSGGHRKLQFCFFNSTTWVFRSGNDSQWVSRTISGGLYVYRIYMISCEYELRMTSGINGVESSHLNTNIDFHTHNYVDFQLGTGFNNEGEGGTCDFAEIIMWDRFLLPWERKTVVQYLADKWAISVTNTLPAANLPRDDAFNRLPAADRTLARW